MSEVIALGYLGFQATDLGAWEQFATDVLGVQVARPENDRSDQLWLRVDERAWRFELTQAETDGLAFVGWEVAGPEALAHLAQRLQEAGIAVKEDAALAKQRHVTGLITCEDPDGIVLEFFYGAFIPQNQFISPQGYTFVTGDMGLGHIVILVNDEKATAEFYLDLLGFRLSDHIYLGKGRAVFTHVNARHHSMAFGEVKEPKRGRFAHFMLQVDDLNSVGRALDKVLDGAAPLAMTLGCHTNDRMTSFYVYSPSGFEIEFGTDGRQIDDSVWVVSNYDKPSFWGHKSLTNEPVV